MSRKREDLTGKRFNRWKVVRYNSEKSKEMGRPYYDCICDCGTEKCVSGKNLKNGYSKSCGCLIKEKLTKRHKDNREDLTGQFFGRWFVDSYNPEKSEEMGISYWNVTCIKDGNRGCVSAGSLKSGKSKSCGCLQKEKLSERAKNRREDLTGQLFDRWLVESYNSEKSKEMGRAYWNVVCTNEGNKGCVNTYDLKNGFSKSCGCIQREILFETNKNRDYSGENSPAWKNGITSLYMQIRTSTKYKEFVQSILKKNNYVCQLSGKKSKGDLQIHHIKGFAKILEENNITTIKEAENCKELWNENNVIVLSEKWHLGIKTYNPLAFHRIYGTKSFTEEDFYIWFKKFKIDSKKEIDS